MLRRFRQGEAQSFRSSLSSPTTFFSTQAYLISSTIPHVSTPSIFHCGATGGGVGLDLVHSRLAMVFLSKNCRNKFIALRSASSEPTPWARTILGRKLSINTGPYQFFFGSSSGPGLPMAIYTVFLPLPILWLAGWIHPQSHHRMVSFHFVVWPTPAFNVCEPARASNTLRGDVGVFHLMCSVLCQLLFCLIPSEHVGGGPITSIVYLPPSGQTGRTGVAKVLSRSPSGTGSPV